MLDKLILSDITVMIIVVLLLALGLIFLKQLQRHFKMYIQRKVEKEVEIAIIEGRAMPS